MNDLLRTLAACLLVVPLTWTLVGIQEAHACQACRCGDSNSRMQPTDPRADTLYVSMQASSRGERYGEGHPWAFDEWRTDLNLGWSYERTSVTLRMPWLWRSVEFEGTQMEKTSGPGD